VWRDGFCFVRADERTSRSIRRDQSPQTAEATASLSDGPLELRLVRGEARPTFFGFAVAFPSIDARRKTRPREASCVSRGRWKYR
jgi:hypothetical protein